MDKPSPNHCKEEKKLDLFIKASEIWIKYNKFYLNILLLVSPVPNHNESVIILKIGYENTCIIKNYFKISNDNYTGNSRTSTNIWDSI